MSNIQDSLREFKQAAADYATGFIESGMVLGLGHGSTAILAVRNIAKMLISKKITNIVGIPCSKYIGQEAKRLDIPLGNLTTHPTVDITIDGADEVDPHLNLIKGGGGALLMEKRVALASKRVIIIVDHTKYSTKLGTKWPLPVEVNPNLIKEVLGNLSELGAVPVHRLSKGELPFVTDSGNNIVDANFGQIDDPDKLAAELEEIEGIIDHGLFLALATDVIISGPDGIEHLTKD